MNVSRINLFVAGGICALAALTLNFGGCGKAKASTTAGKTAADSAVIKVVVAEIKEGAFEDWGSYSADLRGIDDATLMAPMQGGRVNSVKDVGMFVKAGDGLCDIDGERYEASLAAAKAQVDVAKGDLDRATANVEKGSLGRSAVDGATLAYQNARVMLATAQRAYQDCRCQSPFDGVLVSRTVEQYQTVAPGAPTVRVARTDRLEAVVAIPETEAFSYADGMKTEFRLLQNPTRAYEGRLSSLDRAVDPKSRTVAARIVINNADGTLKPGMVGRARILRRSYANAIVVPSASLLRMQTGIEAMVVENNVARQRTVTVAATSVDSSLVTEGLRAGDHLIVSGAFQVTDGTRVSY